MRFKMLLRCMRQRARYVGPIGATRAVDRDMRCAVQRACEVEHRETRHAGNTNMLSRRRRQRADQRRSRHAAGALVREDVFMVAKESEFVVILTKRSGVFVGIDVDVTGRWHDGISGSVVKGFERFVSAQCRQNRRPHRHHEERGWGSDRFP